MTAKEIVKVLLGRQHISQNAFAKMCGMKQQSNVTGVLNRYASMRVDTLEQMATALGYEVVVRPKNGDGEEFIIHEAPTPPPESK